MVDDRVHVFVGKERIGANFMTLLAAPPRSRMRDGDPGENIFERLGCASCHLATLRTGSSDIAALSNKTFHPYSDFLRHDMGSLARDRFVALDAKDNRNCWRS